MTAVVFICHHIRVLWCLLSSIGFTKKYLNARPKHIKYPEPQDVEGKTNTPPRTSRASTDPRVRSRTPKTWSFGVSRKIQVQNQIFESREVVQSSRVLTALGFGEYIPNYRVQCLESSGCASLVPGQAQRSGPDSGKGKR